MKRINQSFILNVLKVLFASIVFGLILFFIMYSSSIPGKTPVTYETIDDFEKSTDISFYKMYSLYDYIKDNKRLILGEEKDCLIQCQNRSKDTYVVKENKHLYHIFYGKITLNQDSYFKKTENFELSIQNQKDYIWISYSTDKISYSINLYENIDNKDYHKIEQYIYEVAELNK